MDDGYASWSILVVVGLVVEFIYHGYLAALKALNEAALEREASEEDSEEARDLLELVKKRKKIRTCQLTWSVLITMSWGLIAVNGLHEWLLESSLKKAWVTAAVCVTVLALAILFVSIGHLVPKWIASRRPEKWAKKLNGLANLLSVPVWPLTLVAEGIAMVVVRLFGIDPHAEDVVTEEEIVSMVNEGQEQGIFEANEAEMINNIIEFGDKQAGEIMTHRKNVVAVSGDTDLEHAVLAMLDEGFSRVPVYEEELDDVIGFLNLKDAIKVSRDASLKRKPIREIDGLLREITFIPETRNVSDLFKTMQSEKIHIVMVVDEYGQIAGLITMEDILEEIVGNILDEYDAEEKFVTRLEGGYLLKGLTPLEEVEEILDIRLEEEEYETLNGLLISRLGRIPGEDEKPELDYEGYHFAVQKLENKTIHTVKVTPLPKEEV
ncbi:MAG: HlyC/CorC family transporter [Lachnospiraceae bacterium]|nr:HlyC/CorC family transporter [Lachnospiraceae bacterium]